MDNTYAISIDSILQHKLYQSDVKGKSYILFQRNLEHKTPFVYENKDSVTISSSNWFRSILIGWPL